MTVIEGNIQDIGMAPLSGVLVATSVDFRASGDVVIAPESRSFPVEAGLVSADLVPGPTRLTVQVGSHARGEFDVVVPDEGPVSLAALVEEAFPWEPEQVAEFVRLRDEARAAAGDAEAAAGEAEGHASDAAASATEAAGSASAASSSASDAAGSASAAAGSATAAASSETAAASSATAAAGSASGAEAARVAAEGHATAAAGHATDAGAEAGRAELEADRAQGYADSFGLTTTTSTGAPGSSAAVTVSGDGPAYSLSFVVPQGAKGDKGDKGDNGEITQAQLDAAVASLVDNAPEALNTLSELADALGNDPNFATTVSTEIGKRALIDGAPAAYNTLGKLVTALQNHELGGSTDASLLTGALTDQVDAGGAIVNFPGADANPMTMPLAVFAATLFGGLDVLFGGLGAVTDDLESKSDVGHTHPVSDVEATGTASSSTFLRGDGSWAEPSGGAEGFEVGPNYGGQAAPVASGGYSVAAGWAAAASGGYSTALGRGAQASSPYTTALGEASQASKDRALALGPEAKATHDTSVAIGFRATSKGANTITIGRSDFPQPVFIPGTLEVGGLPVSGEWQGTQAQYDALGTYDPNVTYYVEE